MMTKYFDFNNKIEEKNLSEIIGILKNDGVIIFPTETVYGIGCNAFSKDAIERIYEIKNRPLNKHLNIFVSNIKEIKKYANIKSKLEERIINKYMPGAITIILDKNKEFSDLFSYDEESIGIRIPDNKIMLEILKRIDFPLATTSANISGMKSNTDIESIINDFDGKVDCVIDGGKAKIGKPSTIVKVENEELKIIREGSIIIEI